MEFKIGDIMTYKDPMYVATYKVISEDLSTFWLQSTQWPQMYFKYNPEIFKLDGSIR